MKTRILSMSLLIFFSMFLLAIGHHDPSQILDPDDEETTRVITVTPEDAVGLMNRSNLIVLDVSSLWQSEHLPRSVNVPYKMRDFREILQKVVPLENPLLVYDHTDQFAEKAAEDIFDMGFDKVYLLEGGLTAWRRAGLEIVRE